jgi:hypothetical protein
METFRKLFGSLLALVYHCFDRVVIQGYPGPADASGAHRPFLPRRARHLPHHEAGSGQEDSRISAVDAGVRPQPPHSDPVARCLSRERRRRFDVSFFRSLSPKFPTDDPRYRILKRNRSRHRHYCFCIRDEGLAHETFAAFLTRGVVGIYSTCPGVQNGNSGRIDLTLRLAMPILSWEGTCLRSCLHASASGW